MLSKINKRKTSISLPGYEDLKWAAVDLVAHFVIVLAIEPVALKRQHLVVVAVHVVELHSVKYLQNKIQSLAQAYASLNGGQINALTLRVGTGGGDCCCFSDFTTSNTFRLCIKS